MTNEEIVDDFIRGFPKWKKNMQNHYMGKFLMGEKEWITMCPLCGISIERMEELVGIIKELKKNGHIPSND